MTPYTLPNKTFLAKISLKSIPDLALFEAHPLGVVSLAGLQPDARRDGKKLQLTYFTPILFHALGMVLDNFWAVL